MKTKCTNTHTLTQIGVALFMEIHSYDSSYMRFYFFMPAMQFILDENGDIVDVNEFAARYLGYMRTELIGTSPFALVHPEDRKRVRHRSKWLFLHQPNNIHSLEFRALKKNGEIILIQQNMSQMTSEDGKTLFLISCHHIPSEKKARQLLTGQKKVLEWIAKELPLSDILTEISRTVEEIRPNILCSILLMNDETKKLYHAAAPSLPADYVETINGMEVKMNAGSCGTAAYQRDLVIVSDVQTSPLWQRYQALARSHGLRACWSIPIFSSTKKVLGTFAMYHREPCEPDTEDMDLIYTFSSLAGLAIEQARMREELQESRQHYQSLFEYNQDAVFSLHLDGTFFAANGAAAQITGYSRHELLSMTLHDLVIGEDWPKTIEAFANTAEGYSRHVDFRIQHKTGTILSLNATSIPIFINKKIIGVSVIAKDVTEREEREERIQQMAYYDPLTGLPNRRLFPELVLAAVKKARENGKMAAVLYMDIDRFKYVNDSLGHSFGDQVLQKTADLIKKCVANSGTVARMGGDEFTVILPNLDHQEQAIDIAQRILRMFQDPVQIDDLELFLTLSIGISLYPQHSENVDALIQYADIAMYEVKQKGKNDYYVFQDDHLKKKLPDLILLGDLHKSIRNRELFIVYQPIIDVKTTKIRAMETLVRWYHPVHGTVPPSEFIPLAEETGFIVSIGEWVIRQACEQHEKWKKIGLPPVRIAVNISVKELQDQHFAKRVEAILSQKQISPEYLELEITESLMIYNEPIILNNLMRMKEIGVRLSIDDFGTGYSSLAYLKRLDVDTVKIDQSFIADCPRSYYGSVITTTIISLAHHLGMNVIAEGVEHLDQFRYLEEKGCQEAQGYLFSRPLHPKEATKLLFQGIRHLY